MLTTTCARAALVIGLFGSALTFATPVVAASSAVAEGAPAPTAIGLDADGRPVSVADYAGKVVVVSFWASWCGPCLKELPILEGIALTAGKDRVRVIAVNIESRDVYRQLMKKMSSLAITVASDASREAQKTYGVQGIPHMVIIGKDGRVLRVHRGYTDAGVDEAIADLNRALAM